MFELDDSVSDILISTESPKKNYNQCLALIHLEFYPAVLASLCALASRSALSLSRKYFCSLPSIGIDHPSPLLFPVLLSAECIA
jgi:hypothetical protein